MMRRGSYCLGSSCFQSTSSNSGQTHAPYLDLPGLDPASIALGYGIETVQIGSLDELEAFVAAGTEATSPRLAVVPQRSVR